MKLYRRRAHVHHYTEFVEASVLEEASERMLWLIEQYSQHIHHRGRAALIAALVRLCAFTLTALPLALERAEPPRAQPRIRAAV